MLNISTEVIGNKQWFLFEKCFSSAENKGVYDEIATIFISIIWQKDLAIVQPDYWYLLGFQFVQFSKN